MFGASFAKSKAGARRQDLLSSSSKPSIHRCSLCHFRIIEMAKKLPASQTTHKLLWLSTGKNSLVLPLFRLFFLSQMIFFKCTLERLLYWFHLCSHGALQKTLLRHFNNPVMLKDRNLFSFFPIRNSLTWMIERK